MLFVAYSIPITQHIFDSYNIHSGAIKCIKVSKNILILILKRLKMRALCQTLLEVYCKIESFIAGPEKRSRQMRRKMLLFPFYEHFTNLNIKIKEVRREFGRLKWPTTQSEWKSKLGAEEKWFWTVFEAFRRNSFHLFCKIKFRDNRRSMASLGEI